MSFFSFRSWQIAMFGCIRLRVLVENRDENDENVVKPLDSRHSRIVYFIECKILKLPT